MKLNNDPAVDTPKLVSNSKQTGAYLNEAMQDTVADHPHADETHDEGIAYALGLHAGKTMRKHY